MPRKFRPRLKALPNDRHVFPGIGHNHGEMADEVYRFIKARFTHQGVLKP